MKMALQWHLAAGRRRTRFFTIRGGYHGDTFSPMSVTDPVERDARALPRGAARARLRAAAARRPRPGPRRPASWSPGSARPGRCTPRTPTRWPPSSSSRCCRAPAGCTSTARTCSRCCTSWPASTGRWSSTTRSRPGFHRTGPLWAGRTGQRRRHPDILCVGKALTGGYLTLAAVLCTREVAEGVSAGEAGGLMHGPTFMGNPLACAIASANLDLLAVARHRGRGGPHRTRADRGPGARGIPRPPSPRCGCWVPSASCSCASRCGWPR